MKNDLAKKFMKGWIGGTLISSFLFFSKKQTLSISNQYNLAFTEGITAYFKNANIYHNYFMDYSISAYVVYQLIHRHLSNKTTYIESD